MCKFGQHKSRTMMPKVEADTESQKQWGRHLRENDDPRGPMGGLSIADVPKIIRDETGSQMNQIQILAK